MDTIISAVEDIMTKNQGEIYSINDFYHLAAKNTVKSALYRLHRDNAIIRVLEGLYTKPKYSAVLKEYSYPTVNAVAEKLADKFSWTICPAGDTALNYAGLSAQVPNTYVYLSDGPSREYTYRNTTILFKHTTNRNIKNYSRELSILIQAIIALKQENISDKDIETLAVFSRNIGEDLTKDTLKLPVWIRTVLQKIKEKITYE